MFQSRLLTTLLFLSFCIFISCGRMGPPKPPEESAPQAVRYLELQPSENLVKLKFQAPLKTVGGEDILGLKVFYISRRSLTKDASERFVNIAKLLFDLEKNDAKSDWFEYQDQNIVTGGQYEYIVVAEDEDGYESAPPYTLRVTFLGTNSVVENLPFEAN